MISRGSTEPRRNRHPEVALSSASTKPREPVPFPAVGPVPPRVDPGQDDLRAPSFPPGPPFRRPPAAAGTGRAPRLRDDAVGARRVAPVLDLQKYAAVPQQPVGREIGKFLVGRSRVPGQGAEQPRQGGRVPDPEPMVHLGHGPRGLRGSFRRAAGHHEDRARMLPGAAG